MRLDILIVRKLVCLKQTNMFFLTCFYRDIKSLCLQDIKVAAKMSREAKRTAVGVEG